MRTRMLVALAALAAAMSAPSSHAQTDCSDATGIFDIQGKGHVSPLAGQGVETCGVVTANTFSGYYIQDLEGDGDDASSDGIYVVQSDNQPAVGTLVRLSASVSEIINGGAQSGNLSVTALTNAMVVGSTPNSELPDPIVIGNQGRTPPDTVVISSGEIDPAINLQNAADASANPFNPDTDGIDFYESLEGMLVSVSNPVAVSAIRQFASFSAEVFVLADGGAGGAGRTARGGIFLGADPDNRGDQNPERIQIQFSSSAYGSTQYPAIKVSDQLQGVRGVMSYDFGNFEIVQLGPLTVQPQTLEPETTQIEVGSDDLTVASYNVLNLSAVADDNEQRQQIAAHIATALKSPDIVALQEIQDDNGDIGDCPDDQSEACAGELDASITLEMLVSAIAAENGVVYDFVSFNPLLETTDDNRSEPDTFGGVSLGNIRNAFLYNPARVELLGAQHLTRDVLAARGISVPNAFDSSRDPLQGVFQFGGKTIQILNNHFESRFGSSPIFGGPQPFFQAAESAREAQASAMHEWVAAELATDPDARVVVLGDLNTFEFTNDLAGLLPAASGTTVLTNLLPTASTGDAYSFIFEGNSQALDHVFATPSLAANAVVDYVHVNVDFPRLFGSVVGSDHEPLLARFKLSEAGGEGGGSASLQLSADVYSTSAIELFWSRLEGADAYEVYRDGELLATIDGTSYFQAELAGATTYEYRVVALASGSPLAEASVTVATLGGEPSATGPLPVADLTGTVYSTTALELFWQIDSSSTPIVRFDIKRDGEMLGSTDGRSFFEEGLTPGTTYTYEVTAVDANGQQSEARTVELTTSGDVRPASGPAPVAELTGLVYSSTAVEIFWKPGADPSSVVGYEVFRNNEQVNVSDGLSFFDEGLMPDTSYIYQVLSYDSEGRRSSAVSIELITRSGGATSANGPGAVESLSGQVYSSTAVEIFWQPPADADATTVYEVFRDDELVLATDGRSYFDSSLSAGTTYAYAVRAVSGDGQPGELTSVELMTSE